jgi:hypothetical protein
VRESRPFIRFKPPKRIPEMLKLDHISIIAPSLAEGVAHVRACLDLDVPFGQRHAYMGTYNHLLARQQATHTETSGSLDV